MSMPEINGNSPLQPRKQLHTKKQLDDFVKDPGLFQNQKIENSQNDAAYNKLLEQYGIASGNTELNSSDNISFDAAGTEEGIPDGAGKNYAELAAEFSSAAEEITAGNSDYEKFKQELLSMPRNNEPPELPQMQLQDAPAEPEPVQNQTAPQQAGKTETQQDSAADINARFEALRAQQEAKGAHAPKTPADNSGLSAAELKMVQQEQEIARTGMLPDAAGVQTAQETEVPQTVSALDLSINTEKNLNGTQKSAVKEYSKFEGKQSQAVMQKYNLLKEGVSPLKKFVTNDAATTDKMILSTEELKQKFGSLEELTKARDELKESVMNDLENSGFKFTGGKKDFNVELCCSDCVRKFEPGQKSNSGPKCTFVKEPDKNTNPNDIDPKTGFVGTDEDKKHGHENNHAIYHAHTDNQGLIVKSGVQKQKGKLRDGGNPVNEQAKRLTNFDFNDNNQKALGTIYNMDKLIAEWNK